MQVWASAFVRVELESPIDPRLRLLQRRLATVPPAEAGVEKAHEADQRVERGRVRIEGERLLKMR